MPLPDRDAGPALRRLQAEWRLFAGGAAVLLVTLPALLFRGWDHAPRWALAAAVPLAYLLAAIWLRLPLNRAAPPEAPLHPDLGLANRVTLLRAYATAMLAGFLVAPWPTGGLAWMPAALYAVVALGDVLDGWLARRTGRVTLFGGWLDQELDGLSMLLAALLAWHFGRVPPSYLLVGLARYLFLVAGWLHERRGGCLLPLPPSPYRRLWAGMQMGFLVVALWPVAPAAGTRLAAVVFAVPFLVGFVRDGLAVVGGLDARASERLETLGARLASALPLVARAVVAVTAGLVFLAGRDRFGAGWGAVLERWGFPFAERWATLFVLLAAAAVVAIVSGTVGRMATLALLFAFVLELQEGTPGARAGPDVARSLLLAATLVVLLFGTGRLSLWRPEDRVLMRED